MNVDKRFTSITYKYNWQIKCKSGLDRNSITIKSGKGNCQLMLNINNREETGNILETFHNILETLTNRNMNISSILQFYTDLVS